MNGLDVCVLCDSARVPEDDDGHAGALDRHATGSGCCWVTVGGRRVCGACVAGLVREAITREGRTNVRS